MKRSGLPVFLKKTKKLFVNSTLITVLGLNGLAALTPLFLSQTAYAAGNTLYVAKTGVDSGNCQTAASPCLTIGYAVSQAANSGDTIEVASGTYYLTAELDITAPLTISGQGSVTIKSDNSSWSSTSRHLIGIYAGTEVSPVSISNVTIDSNGQSYGVNTYNSAYGVFDNVTIQNSKGAALTVNGSTIVATDLNTSGNSWGAVNVDPGSGVVTTSVFTLNSGNLSESNKIWSDGSHVSGSATVTVNAAGYDMYKVGGTTAGYFWTNNLTNYATITKNGVTTAYPTVQAAVAAAETNDTISLAAGTYGGFSVSGKTNLTIKGAGPTSTIIAPTTLIDSGTQHKYTSDMKVSVFVNNSSNITIESTKITDNGSAPGYGGPDALVFWNGSTGTLSNDNIAASYAVNGIQSGQGIALDGNSGAVSLAVNNTSISGFQKNGIDVIDGNGVTSGATDTTTLTVSGGSITGAGVTGSIAQNGIVLWDRGGGSVSGSIKGVTISRFHYTPIASDYATNILVYGNSTGATVSNSSLTDADYAIANEVSGKTVNASNNYWGAASPSFSSITDGSVATNPYFTNSAMTTLSNATTVPDSSGNATATNTNPTVVVSSSSTPINVTVSSGTTSATIDYSALKTSSTQAIVPQTTIQSSTADVQIPSGTVITASGSWDGTIMAPTVQSATSISIPTATGTLNTVGTVIEVGSSSVNLTFSKAVRLLIPGQAGMLVGYERSGVFTQITTACSADSQAAGDALPAGGECYIGVGSDMVIWTKHFTTFVTYTKNNTYTVQSGDTMRGIAYKLGLTLAKLEALNPNAGHPAGNFSLILPGDVLNVGDAVLIKTASVVVSSGGASPVLGSSANQPTTGGSALSTKTVKKAPEVGSTPTGKHISIWVWWTLVAVALVSVILYVASLLNRKSN